MQKQFLVVTSLLIVVSLLISCSLRESGQSSSAPRAPITRLPGNEIYESSCEAISRYRDIVGVQDKEGNPHSGFAGWTDAKFSHSPFTFDYRSIPLITCGCSTKIYDDLQVCRSECKATLKCFTNICGPVEGLVCLETERVFVTFSAEANSYTLVWKPPQRLSSACLIEKSKWENNIEVHEDRHVQDTKDIVNNTNSEWKKPIKYRACGSTEEEARNQLEDQIKAELDKEVDKMEAELIRRSDIFHSTEEGSPLIDPDCSVCN